MPETREVLRLGRGRKTDNERVHPDAVALRGQRAQEDRLREACVQSGQVRLAPQEHRECSD